MLSDMVKRDYQKRMEIWIPSSIPGMAGNIWKCDTCPKPDHVDNEGVVFRGDSVSKFMHFCNFNVNYYRLLEMREKVLFWYMMMDFARFEISKTRGEIELGKIELKDGSYRFVYMSYGNSHLHWNGMRINSVLDKGDHRQIATQYREEWTPLPNWKYHYSYFEVPGQIAEELELKHDEVLLAYVKVAKDEPYPFKTEQPDTLIQPWNR